MRASDHGWPRCCAAVLLALALSATLLHAALALSPAGDPPAAAGDTAPGPDTAAPAGPGRVGYAHVLGPIDRMRERYLARAVESAQAAGVETLVVHIDTDGGAVVNAREMFKRIVDLRRDDLLTVAFVDYRAISAGALLAYGHQQIYLAETASIGDIGVVFRSAEGEIEYAPEKIETVIRALLVQAAEQNGWSRGLLLKMTAHKQKLYQVSPPDGSVEYVIEDDLPAFLARHPDIDREDPQQVLVYRGEDRLLTLTGREAVRLGMATGTAADLEALYAQLGVAGSAVLDFSPSTTERIASQLATIAPLLAGLALLFVLLEAQAPGIGLWAALAALAGGGFLLAQYYLDMVENLAVVLLLLGLVLMVAEMILMATGGILAVLGGALVFGGLLLMFLPNEARFDPADPVFMAALLDAALSALLALGVVAVGVLAAIYLLPRSRLQQRLAVRAEVTATSAGRLADAAPALLGARGTAREALHPGGTVRVDGRDLGARVQHGGYVAGGSTVEVVGVEFGELLVRAVDTAPVASAAPTSAQTGPSTGRPG